MYVLEHDLKGIDLGGKKVLTLIQSINQPMVAAADYPAEATQAFVVTVQASDQSIESFIYLHLTKTNQCVMYRYGDAPMMVDLMEDAETEALEFVESMGFIMDNLRYTKVDAGERAQIERDTPIFYPNLKDFKAVLSEKQEHHVDDLDQKPEVEEEPEEEEEIDPLYRNAPAGETEIEGSAPAVVDVNEVDEFFESSEPVRVVPEPKKEQKKASPPPWWESWIWRISMMD